MVRRPAAARRVAIAGLTALAALACTGQPEGVALGFTYNWGDSELEAFVQAEVNRTAARRRDSLQLLTSRSGGWRAYGTTPLTAEVRRASILAENPAVVTVVGPGGSREALQVAAIYAQHGVPQLVPTGTSRLLAAAGSHTFVVAPNDSVQGEFIAAFADTALGARRVAILYVPDEYGIGLAAGTASTIAARGLMLVDRSPVRLTQECRTEEGRRYHEGVVAALARRGRPDAVVLATRTVEAACLGKALRARWPGVHLLVGDGAYLNTAYFDIAGRATEGAHLVAFWHEDLPDTASRAFAMRYRAATGQSARHGDAVFRDAAVLAATAIRSVGADRGKITAYYRSLGDSRPPFEGVTGPIAFTPGFRRMLLMTRIEGTRSVLVQQR